MSSPSNLNEKPRSGKRLPISMPVVLNGRDSEKNSFLEMTRTLAVNRGGAKLLTKQNLSKGQRLQVRIPHLNREAIAHVVWVNIYKKDRSQREVGVALDQPSGDFWGVHFPQESETGASPVQPSPLAAQSLVTPAPATGSEGQTGLQSRMFGVLQEFVAAALEESVASLLLRTRRTAEANLALASQEVLEQAQQRLRQAASQDAEALQEGLRRAGQELVSRVDEQLAQVAGRRNQEFERDIQDALRSGVAGWGAFLADSERGTAARVQEAISATIRQQLQQACQEAQESAVRAARLRLASMLCEFDSGLAEAEARGAGRFEASLEEVKRQSMEQAAASFAQAVGESTQRLMRSAAAGLEQELSGIMAKAVGVFQDKLAQAGKSTVETALQRLESQARERLSQITHEAVSSAQNEAILQTQVSLRAAVESALEQLEMRAIDVVHHNEQACNQALSALADAHEARLSAHLAECQAKLSSSARKILQELARSLASLNFGSEKPVE